MHKSRIRDEFNSSIQSLRLNSAVQFSSTRMDGGKKISPPQRPKLLIVEGGQAVHELVRLNVVAWTKVSGSIASP